MPQAAAVARRLLRKLHISRIRSCSPVPPDRSGTATHSPALPWQLGQTALHCAAGYGALPIVKALIDGGADKSITDMDGNTPCELAKNYGACSPPALLPPASPPNISSFVFMFDHDKKSGGNYKTGPGVVLL